MNQIKKIFITGATGGIGSAITELFYNKKFSLVLTSSSDQKISDLKSKFGNNHYLLCKNLYIS